MKEIIKSESGGVIDLAPRFALKNSVDFVCHSSVRRTWTPQLTPCRGSVFTQGQNQGPSSTVFLKTPSLLPLKPLKLCFPWPQIFYPESPRGWEAVSWGKPSLSVLLQKQSHPTSITISLSLSSFVSMACVTMETTIYMVHWWYVCVSFSPS